MASATNQCKRKQKSDWSDSPDITSLRSSETSLAWAVSKVSGSRWNRLEGCAFFRAALYFSWNARSRRGNDPSIKSYTNACGGVCGTSLCRSEATLECRVSRVSGRVEYRDVSFFPCLYFTYNHCNKSEVLGMSKKHKSTQQ